jgi:hypothetical protein
MPGLDNLEVATSRLFENLAQGALNVVCKFSTIHNAIRFIDLFTTVLAAN